MNPRRVTIWSVSCAVVVASLVAVLVMWSAVVDARQRALVAEIEATHARLEVWELRANAAQGAARADHQALLARAAARRAEELADQIEGVAVRVGARREPDNGRGTK